MFASYNDDRPIYLTGFMATGKSRVGTCVATRLGWECLDTDAEIVARDGRQVSDIFAQSGEAAFRTMELEVLKDLSQRSRVVIALGGGTLTNPEAMSTVRRTGWLVRLWAKAEIIADRVGRRNNRPLLAGLEPAARLARITEMLDQREPFYSQADFAVESSDQKGVEQVADEILHRMLVWQKRALEVRTTTGQHYPILIGTGWLKQLPTLLAGLRLDTHAALIVTDENVAHKQEANLQVIQHSVHEAKVFRFPPGETQKSLPVLNRLYTFMLRRGYSRKSVLLQFGGGVVGDMAGFGAATYQRGIPFVQIPTTLLSMVDSSVGGKVAVNHPEGKNMIGAFYQPHAVCIDLQVLESLPHDEFLAGMAEVIKYGVIRDPHFFNWLEGHVGDLLARDPEALTYIVKRSCELKAEVVGIDEKETGLRAILNYGHTFGHAIEKITNYQGFTHGLAVNLGMRVAGRLSTLLGRWTVEDEMRQNALLDAFGMPKFFAVDPEEAWQAMGIDKKVEKAKRVYILPDCIGNVEKVVDPDRELVDQAWDAIREGTP